MILFHLLGRRGRPRRLQFSARDRNENERDLEDLLLNPAKYTLKLNFGQFFRAEDGRQLFIGCIAQHQLLVVDTHDQFSKPQNREAILRAALPLRRFIDAYKSYFIAVSRVQATEENFYETLDDVMARKGRDDCQEIQLMCICGDIDVAAGGNDVIQCADEDCGNRYHRTCILGSDDVFVDEDWHCSQSLLPFSGLQWSDGKVRNTCTIDNYLTAIILGTYQKKRLLATLEKHDPHIFKVVKNCTYSKNVQEYWLKNLAEMIHRDRSLASLNSATDLHGSAEQRFFPMVRGMSWRRTYICACGAPQQDSRPFQEVFVTRGSIQDTVTGDLAEASLNCHDCKRKTIPGDLMPEQNYNYGITFNIEVHPSYKFSHVREEKLRQSFRAVFREDNVIAIGEEVYEKTMVHLYDGSHFTSFIKFEGLWYYYDGIRRERKFMQKTKKRGPFGETKLVPIPHVQDPEEYTPFPPEVEDSIAGKTPYLILYLKRSD